MSLILIVAAAILTLAGYTSAAIAILSAVTLLRARRWALERWGNYTLGCILGMHDGCDMHLICECPHHDEVIHQEMAK